MLLADFMRRIVPFVFSLAVVGCSSSHSADDAGPRPDGCTGDCIAPIGCSYVGGSGCECGTLVCPDGCGPAECEAPPIGCRYEGGDFCTCGTLICDGIDACVPPPCAFPPPGCAWEGGGPCECGTLRCGDAGVCPPGNLVEPDVVCFDGAEVPTVDIVVYEPDGCFCGETIACSATQDAEGIHIDVRADACGDLCEACFHELRGSCRLDGVRLTPSPVYDVSINGRPALSGLSWGGSQCWTPAGEADGGLLFCGWPGTGVDAATVTTACVPTSANAYEPIVVRTNACIDDCFAQEAGCQIIPTTGGYQVIPLLRSCECPTCGPCAPGCYDRAFYCTLPPLPNGSYEITLAGQTRPLVVSDSGTDNFGCDDRTP